MIRSCLPPVVCIWLCLSGCNTQPVSTPPLTAALLAAGAHCAHADASGKAVWLDNSAELLEAYAVLDKQRLGAPAPGPRPEIDFAHYGAVAVFMGRKPSAGYGLSLADPTVSMENNAAELRLKFETPAPGSLTAQMITSPCILVRLPKAGYSTVRIVDQHGKPRFRLTVNTDQ